MRAEPSKVGQVMVDAIDVMRHLYEECYLLDEEVRGHVESRPEVGLSPYNHFTYEQVSTNGSGWCLRSRLARFYLPAAASVSEMPKADVESRTKYHIRLEASGSLPFVTIELYDADTKLRDGDANLQRPTVFVGRVHGFSGVFVMRDHAMINRGDLAPFLDSVDWSVVPIAQEARGRTKDRRARVEAHAFALLAAIESGGDIELLARELIKVHKDGKG